MCAGQGPAANTSRMLGTFGAGSDKGVMSALGEREQILGRVLWREGTAGAPAAAEPLACCPSTITCTQGPHLTSAITINRKPQPSRWLAPGCPCFFPRELPRQMDPGWWQEVAAALVLLRVLSTWFQEATSLIK